MKNFAIFASIIFSGIFFSYFFLIKKFENFPGELWWDATQLALCDRPEIDTNWRRNDSICFTYFHNLLPVDVEIINWSPALVIYRNFLSTRQIVEFKKIIDQQELQEQSVQDDGNSKRTSQRRANGSFIWHHKTEITAEIHLKLKKRIPTVDFDVAEPFSALSYIPGGHYAVHYDFLSYASEASWDWWMKNMNNRMATLIFVIQAAEKGGGTVFPSMNTTIRANAGDAFFWFNERGDESQEMLSNHGGCPIYSGRKVISTLWIRAKNQSILPMTSSDEPVGAEYLIPSGQFARK